MGRKVLRLIAAAEVLGAGSLLVQMLPDLPKLLQLGPGWGLAMAVLGLVLLLLVLTLVAGVLLWRQRPAGLVLSLLAQLAQVPHVALPAFTWQLALGLGGTVALNPDTGILHTTWQVGSPALLMAPLQSGPPQLGLNLLAAFLACYLLRTLWGQHRVAQALARGEPLPEPAPPLPWPRRLLRAGWRLLWVGTAVVALPVLALWVYNRIDEAPTPAAQRWFAPIEHSVPDAQNAWLALLGMGAAEGQDPIGFGRQRLRAYEARIAERPVPGPPGAEEVALQKDPLPFVDLDARGQKLDLVCAAGRRDCLAWARERAAELTRLEAANATRLQRFERLFDLPGFADPSTPSAASPLPVFSTDDHLYRALILRDLGQPARRAQALLRLQRATEFWRRVLAQADQATVKTIVRRILARYLQVLDALLDREGAGASSALQGVATVLLNEATPAERAWEPAYRRHLLSAEHTWSSLVRGPVDMLRHCPDNCLRIWVSGQFYLRQASRNQAARLWDAVLAEHMADPREWPAKRRQISALVDDIQPDQGSPGEMLRKMKHNFVGRSLVLLDLPAYAEPLALQHDLEGLRRLLRLKWMALQRGLAPGQMRGFLASQPTALRHPFTGEAFEWHAASQTMRFAPQSTLWKQPHFALGYAPTAR